MNRQQRRGLRNSDFADAVSHQQAGRQAAAEQIYRRMLAGNPLNAAAFSNLAMTQIAQGRPLEAIISLRRALALQPDYPQALVNLGDALRVTSQAAEALKAYRGAERLMPPHALLQNNIGVTLALLDQRPEALEAFRQAVAIDPAQADAQANLARMLMQLCPLDVQAQHDAVAALRCALAIAPNSVECLSDLGLALTNAGECEEGAAMCRAAIALQPGHSSAYVHLANALQKQRDYAGAAEACRAGLAHAPAKATLHNSLAAAAVMLGDLQTAATAARRAIELQPVMEIAWFNLGYALERLGDLAGAADAQRRALALDPGFAAAELKLAYATLAQGDYASGLELFEARWRTSEHVSQFQHLIDQPRWQGEALGGRTILLHWEQGLGDTLQLLRFVPQVVQRGGQVLLVVQPALRALVPAWNGVTVFTDPAEIPPFEVHCSLFSLPLMLGLTHANIPAPIPYLHANAGAAALWRQRLACPERRIGLVWAGNASHKGDGQRTIPLPTLAPLINLPATKFFSFQRDLRPGDAAWLAGPGAMITDLGPELLDFSVTAAALSAMDLLITVDTSVCHLAGALGLPVWLLLPFSPEWRWAPDAEVSAWYPNVRLLRQATPGDWPKLVAQARENLASSERN